MHVLTSIVTSSSEHNSRNLYFFLLEVLFKTHRKRQSPILKTLLKHRLKKCIVYLCLVWFFGRFQVIQVSFNFSSIVSSSNTVSCLSSGEINLPVTK